MYYFGIIFMSHIQIWLENGNQNLNQFNIVNTVFTFAAVVGGAHIDTAETCKFEIIICKANH